MAKIKFTKDDGVKLIDATNVDALEAVRAAGWKEEKVSSKKDKE